MSFNMHLLLFNTMLTYFTSIIQVFLWCLISEFSLISFFTIKLKETESSAEESDRSNTPSLHKHLPSSKPQKAKAHKEPPPAWGPGFPGFPPGPPPHAFRQVREILYFLSVWISSQQANWFVVFGLCSKNVQTYMQNI